MLHFLRIAYVFKRRRVRSVLLETPSVDLLLALLAALE